MTQRESIEETVLCEAYCRQIEHYELALVEAEELVLALEAGEDGEKHSLAIAEMVTKVSEIEEAISEVKVRWRNQTSGKPGSRLRTIFDQITSLVERILERAHQAEVLTEEKKAQLLPQMDLQARARRREKAYGKS